MMITASNNITKWAQQRGDEYLAQGRLLAADGREDEATLMRVRSNICGVFGALVRAAQKRDNTDSELKKLAEKTSSPWVQRLTLAQTHGDAVTATIEQVKLETMTMLMGEWIRRTGGTAS